MTRNVALLLALLLWALPAWGQEFIYPDGEDDPATWFTELTTAGGGSCGTACSSTTCDTWVDDDPDSASTTYIAGDVGTVLVTIKFTFPSPSGNPDTSTNAQVVNLRATRNDLNCDNRGTGNDPTYTLVLYCNGVLKTALATDVSVTVDGQIDSYNFTYTPDTDCDAAGANVELQWESTRPGGPTADRNHAALYALEWEATIAAASARRIIVGIPN